MVYYIYLSLPTEYLLGSLGSGARNLLNWASNCKLVQPIFGIRAPLKIFWIHIWSSGSTERELAPKIKLSQQQTPISMNFPNLIIWKGTLDELYGQKWRPPPQMKLFWSEINVSYKKKVILLSWNRLYIIVLVHVFFKIKIDKIDHLIKLFLTTSLQKEIIECCK